MDSDYARHLQVKLVAATGVGTSIAQQIQQQSDVAKRFSDVFLALASLKNPGNACVARKVVRDLCVVDMFSVLGSLPSELFGLRDLREAVLKYAQPIYKGNRFHVAAKKRRVEQLASEFAEVYRELMSAAKDFYESREEMERSICRRAAFENRPLDALYCHPLYERLNRAIEEYKTTGNAKIISSTIDTLVGQSLRNLDRLWVHRPSLRVI